MQKSRRTDAPMSKACSDGMQLTSSKMIGASSQARGYPIPRKKGGTSVQAAGISSSHRARPFKHAKHQGVVVGEQNLPSC